MRARTKVKLCRISVMLGILTIFFVGMTIESLTFVEDCVALSAAVGFIYIGKGFSFQKK